MNFTPWVMLERGNRVGEPRGKLHCGELPVSASQRPLAVTKLTNDRFMSARSKCVSLTSQKRMSEESQKRQTQFATSFHSADACAEIAVIFGLRLWVFHKWICLSLLFGICFSSHFELTRIKWLGKYVISHAGCEAQCVFVLQLIFFPHLARLNVAMIFNTSEMRWKLDSRNEKRKSSWEAREWGFRQLLFVCSATSTTPFTSFNRFHDTN